MNQKTLAAQKLEMVKEYQSSGQTAVTWCEEHQIKVSNLRYWISRSKQIQSSIPISGGFVELRQIGHAPGSPIYIHCGEFRLELHPGFDPGLLKETIQTLKML